MTKLGLALFALALGLAPAQAQTITSPITQFTIPITGTVAVATKIVSGNASKQTVVTAIGLIPAATSVVTFTAGTGTNCGTNTTSLTGAMTFTTSASFFYGIGNGAVLVLPKGYDLCITIATAAAPGTIAYAQF